IKCTSKIGDGGVALLFAPVCRAPDNCSKGSIPDWQFPGGVPNLHRENKSVRILQKGSSFLMQKKASAEWRNVGGSATPNLSD
ncbi:hypothetical protein ACC734_39020, partial [Rhizobium ruizarguesonis]